MGAQNKVHWSAPVISFGLIGFGATFGLTLGSAYLVDSFGDASSSALTAMTTMKVCVAKNFSGLSRVGTESEDCRTSFLSVPATGQLLGLKRTVLFLSLAQSPASCSQSG